MSRGYPCDICGEIIYVDPGEERICDRCQHEKEKRIKKIRYEKNFVEQLDGQLQLAI